MIPLGLTHYSDSHNVISCFSSLVERILSGIQIRYQTFFVSLIFVYICLILSNYIMTKNQLRRYYRLFYKLFWQYTLNGMDAFQAISNANNAFTYLTGYDYSELVQFGQSQYGMAQYGSEQTQHQKMGKSC